MAVTVQSTGTAVNGTGSLTPTIPSFAAGDVAIAHVRASSGSEVISTATPGWELLKQGAFNGHAAYAKKLVGGDENPTFTFSGATGHIAQIFVLRSSIGFPSVASLVQSSAATQNASGSAGSLVYGSLDVIEDGNCGIQLGSRNTTTGTTNPVTNVATTTNYTSCGWGARNVNGNGVVIAGQMFGPGTPTAAGNIPSNSVAITGNSDEVTRSNITLVLVEAETTFPLAAHPVVETTHSALPVDFQNTIPGGVASGDTYGQNGSPTPEGAVFTLFAGGRITIDFSASGSDSVTIPLHFLDASTGNTHEYSVTFNKNTPPVVAIGQLRRRIGLKISLGL